MLLRPRRLPRRFNRRPTALTRRFVRQRHRRRTTYLWERWKRVLGRIERTSGSLGKTLRTVAIAFSIGLMALLVGLLTFSPLLTVREIRVQRTSPRIDVEQVERALAPVFRRHLFFLSSQDVVHALRQAVPDVTAATIQKRYPSTLIVRLTLDPIIARLRIEEPEAAASPPRTATGVLTEYLTAQAMYVTYQPSYVRREQPEGTLPLVRIVDWGARPAPWTQLITPEFLLTMREAEQMLRDQFGQEVIERTVFLRAQEFHLRTKALILWFDRRSTLEDQLQRYTIFLRTIGLQAAKEYVDLRLRDRVVYK